MIKLLGMVVFIGMVACGGKKQEADNAVTKYTEDLRIDVRQANTVADEANERIRKQEEEYKKIADQ